MIAQPLTGLAMAHIGASVARYAVIVFAWLPVVVIQIRLRDLAHAAACRDEPLASSYRTLFRAWLILGIVALIAALPRVALMVVKPDV